jgi:hypothetical protein
MNLNEVIKGLHGRPGASLRWLTREGFQRNDNAIYSLANFSHGHRFHEARLLAEGSSKLGECTNDTSITPPQPPLTRG